jgi:hypothetical protein
MIPAAAAIPAAAEAVAATAAPAAATAAGAAGAAAAKSGIMAGLLKMLLGGGKYMAASTAGALPFILLPSLLGGEHGGGGASPQDEEEMLQLLQSMGGQARREAGTTRSDMLRTNAMVNMLDRRDAMMSPTSSLGIADDLEQIIRGRESMLSKIAHSEPISLAQAYAARGLFNPVVEQPMSFRGIM